VFFDLETLPNMREAMKVWPQLSNYPGLTLKASITSVICAGWKVYGKKKARCLNAWDFATWEEDINNDYEVVKGIRDVLVDADAVVTQNGKKFDWKHLQTRIMYHKLPPLPKIHHIDTRELASRHLYLFNNRLGTMGKFLVDDDKLENGGWDLWVDVSLKKKKAMKLMTKYCIQDVNLLEKIFERLKPFANLPNRNIFTGDGDNCPNCGSSNLRSEGWRVTSTQKYRRKRCMDCHTYCRTDLKEKNPRVF